jgi:hypothetical protein
MFVVLRRYHSGRQQIAFRKLMIISDFRKVSRKKAALCLLFLKRQRRHIPFTLWVYVLSCKGHARGKERLGMPNTMILEGMETFRKYGPLFSGVRIFYSM